MPKIRIAVLNTHPIQYLAPFYAFLNTTSDIELTALYLSDSSIRGSEDPGFGQHVKWDIDLLAGYRSILLGPRARTRTIGGFFSMIAPEVWGEVRKGRYDALWINGHKLAANHIALAAAKSVATPVLMRAETHLGLAQSRAKAILREPLMKTFYRLCDRFLAIGTANAEFYRAMAVPEERIFLAPYSVDNDRFMAAARLGAKQRPELRKRLGIGDDAPAILYASKFQPRKHPDDLVRAAHKLRAEGLQFHLVMVGAGEMDRQLKALVAELGMTNVVFPGFINQSDLPGVYAACDLFVLPSENEPWGLIVNEVMCAGLPAVVASEVGCVRDLVKHGETGFLFTARDIDGLATVLRRLVQDTELRQRMSQASLQRISNWGYHETHNGLRAAVDSLGRRSSQ